MGKLLKIFRQVVIIRVAKFNDYGQPILIRVLFFRVYRLKKSTNPTIEFGPNTNTFIKF